MEGRILKAKLERLLLEEHSRARTEEVAMLIGGNADHFEIAWDIFCNSAPPLPQRMAWVLTVVTDAHPSLAVRYAASLAARLPYLVHPAEVRAALRILMSTEIPTQSVGELVQCLYPWLEDPKLPAATRVFSMQILYNISNLEPELKRELAFVIETRAQEASPAFKARARTILPKLRREMSRMEKSLS
jgi:hypothetical protein